MVRRLKSEVQKFTWQDFKKRLTILNVLQAIWLFVVCISGAILVLVMFNMVYIADPALKDLWLEVNIQILNGCFTIMAIITQPFRAVLAYWTASFYYSKDDSKKSYYSTKIGEMWKGIRLWPEGDKNEGKIANASAETSIAKDDNLLGQDPKTVDVDLEQGSQSQNVKALKIVPFWKWAVIVGLLNGQCIFQYPITAVHWIWFNKSSERPAWVVGLFLPLSFLCMAVSGIWIYYLTKEDPVVENNDHATNETIPAIIAV